MKDWWKVVLKMALPLIRSAGEAQKAQDENTTGKDDLIGYTLVYLADLAEAVLSGDTNKIQSQLNKVSPK